MNPYQQKSVRKKRENAKLKLDIKFTHNNINQLKILHEVETTISTATPKSSKYKFDQDFEHK